jgi:hypothetical protein
MSDHGEQKGFLGTHIVVLAIVYTLHIGVPRVLAVKRTIVVGRVRRVEGVASAVKGGARVGARRSCRRARHQRGRRAERRDRHRECKNENTMQRHEGVW